MLDDNKMHMKYKDICILFAIGIDIQHILA